MRRRGAPAFGMQVEAAVSLVALRALVVVALVALGVAGWWRLATHYESRGYARAQAEGRQLAEEQAARMRELQRISELRYVVQAETRDRFVVTTVKEIRDAAASLDACPVGADAVRVFNRAAACARGDSTAACDAGEPVPDAR